MSHENEVFTASGLDELLHRNEAAQTHFESLPQEVQDKIMRHRDLIHTDEELQHHINRLIGREK